MDMEEERKGEARKRKIQTNVKSSKPSPHLLPEEHFVDQMLLFHTLEDSLEVLCM